MNIIEYQKMGGYSATATVGHPIFGGANNGPVIRGIHP